MDRELKVGQHLVFMDEYRRGRDALLVAIHGSPNGAMQVIRKDETGKEVIDPKTNYYVWDEVPGTRGKHWPCINLVVVDNNEGATDQYGRQTTKHSSVVHWSNSSAKGFCWRFADEEVTELPEATIR